MLSRALRKLIYQGMPTTITVGGKVFNVAKRYANQYEAEIFPAVTLDYRTISEPKTSNLDRVRRKEREFTETLRYTDPASASMNIQAKVFPVVPGPPGIEKGGYYGNSGHSTYLNAWNTTQCGCGSLGARLCGGTRWAVGQTPKTGVWYIKRSWLYYDILALVGKRIVSVKFKFWPYQKQQGSDAFFNPLPWADFDIDVQYGDETHPTLEMPNSDDFDRTYYSGSLSNKINTASVILGQWNEIVMNANGLLKMVLDRDAGRDYRMTLRCQNDIDGVESIEGWLNSYSSEFAGREPYLEFTYDVPKIQLEAGYAMSITSITGTVSGSPHTFSSSEYQIADEGPTGFYGAVEFLGPNYPDNNTDIVVVYDAAWVREWQGGEFVDIISVECWAKDDKQTKPGGSEQYINGMLIVQELIEIFTQWFRYNCDDLSNDFTVDSVSDVRDLDSTVEGEEERRRQFDVTVAHVESVEKTKVATIESVDEPDYTVE